MLDRAVLRIESSEQDERERRESSHSDVQTRDSRPQHLLLRRFPRDSHRAEEPLGEERKEVENGRGDRAGNDDVLMAGGDG